MDSKERVPDFRINCTLDILEKCLAELRDEVKKEGLAEVDFYYTNKPLEREFKNKIHEYLNIPYEYGKPIE